MIPYCYHTHTYRCGHADGEDEEYVLEAIAAGVRKLGFSDHVMLPNFSQPNVRGDFKEAEGYGKNDCRNINRYWNRKRR